MFQRRLLLSLGFLLATITSQGSLAAFVDKITHNNIAYLLATSSSETVPGYLYRFNLNTKLAAQPIALTGTPLAFAVDDDGIYISFGRRVSAYPIDGSSETHLRNTLFDVSSMAVMGDNLILIQNERVASADDMLIINKTSGALVARSDAFSPSPTFRPLVLNDGNRFIVHQSEDTPSPNLLLLEFDGTDTIAAPVGLVSAISLGTQESAPTRMYYEASSGRLMDHEGNIIVYDTDAGLADGEIGIDDEDQITYVSQDLVYANSAIFTIETITDECSPDRNGTVIRHHNAGANLLREEGIYETSTPSHAFHVDADDATIIHVEDDDTITIEIIPLASFATSGVSLGPIQSALRGDAGPVNNFFLDDSGNVLIFMYTSANGCFSNIYRYNLTTHQYLETGIPLHAVPDQMAYSPELDTIFLGYDGNQTESDVDDDNDNYITHMVLDDTPEEAAEEDDYIYRASDDLGELEQLVPFGNYLLVAGHSLVLDVSDSASVTTADDDLGLDPPTNFYRRFAWDDSTNTYTYASTVDSDGIDMFRMEFNPNNGESVGAPISVENLPSNEVIPGTVPVLGFEVWPLSDGRTLVSNGLIVNDALEEDDNLSIDIDHALYFEDDDTLVTVFNDELRVWPDSQPTNIIGAGLTAANVEGTDLVRLSDSSFVLVDSEFIQGFVVPYFRVFDLGLNELSDGFGEGEASGEDNGGDDNGGDNSGGDDSGGGGGSNNGGDQTPSGGEEVVDVGGSGSVFYLLFPLAFFCVVRRKVIV